jgi:hypothetical protein
MIEERFIQALISLGGCKREKGYWILTSGRDIQKDPMTFQRDRKKS